MSETELQSVRADLMDDTWTFFLFRSPSGDGLKMLTVIDPSIEVDAAIHERFYAYMCWYLKENYELDVKLDTVNKDVSRLCFYSSDTDAYLNYTCECVTMENVEGYEFCEREKKVALEKASIAKTKKPPTAKPKSKGEVTLSEKFEKIVDFTNNKMSYTEGNYNNYVHLFACNCSRYGISLADCLEYSFSCFADYSDVSQLKASIKSGYKKTEADFGKNSMENFLANKKQAMEAVQKMKASKSNNSSNDTNKLVTSIDDVNEKVLFWNTVVEEVKGKEVEKIYFSYDDFIRFLENNGIYRIELGTSYEFVRQQGKFLYNIEERKIREFVFKFLRSKWEYKRILEMMRKDSQTKMSPQTLVQLDSIKIDLMADTASKSFLFFKNGFLEITADDYELKSYNSSDKLLWHKSIIDFEYKKIDPEDYKRGDAYRFLMLAINKIDPNEMDKYEVKRKIEIEPNNENKYIISEEENIITEKRFLSTLTAIGYLLHTYKDPSLVKAVVAVDRKIGLHQEANGGTGKSLLAKMLQVIRPVCFMDGTKLRADNDFLFAKYKLGDAIININETKVSFDMKCLFSETTDEFTWTKKYGNPQSVPFSESPKFYISTNNALNGTGPSHTRRQHIIEFSDFFDSVNSPKKHFGRNLLTKEDWDDEEFNRFHNLMAVCVKMFLKHGLVDFPSENYEMRKLIQAAGEDFVDWCDITIIPGQEYLKGAFVELFKTQNPGHYYAKDNKTNQLYKSLKMYAVAKGMLLNGHKKDGRDKRGSVEYYTFAFKNEPAKENTDLPF